MEKRHAIAPQNADASLHVMFAPDFRELAPYQYLLEKALADCGTDVTYHPGYRRGMPLYRGVRSAAVNILHLHYPQHYFERYNKWNAPRKLRFPFDLRLAANHAPLVYTVHDLHPLDGREDWLECFACLSPLKQASAIIVHSDGMRKKIAGMSASWAEKCVIIPHGDLAPFYGEPLRQQTARKQLGFDGDHKICLVFGLLTPNKGVEELIEFWKRESPDAILAIIGKVKSAEYGRQVTALSEGIPGIVLKCEFQSDEQLRLWFSAADCMILNYGKISTSGVASLARSYGIPILLPARHTTIDLGEPDPSVFRFDTVSTDFGPKLAGALQHPRSYTAAEEWRQSISWNAIAAQTQAVYECAQVRET